MRDMQDAKCHMPQDMPPTGRLSQVPTWASQLFHELAVEHENKRIFAILGCGEARSRRTAGMPRRAVTTDGVCVVVGKWCVMLVERPSQTACSL